MILPKIIEKNGIRSQNIVAIVRTKLQLIIAMETLCSIYQDKKKIIILTAPTASQVAELEELAEYFSRNMKYLHIIKIDQSYNFVFYVLSLCKVMTQSFRRIPSTVMLSSIDCARIGTAIKILGIKRIETFDDGSANYRLGSLYFSRAKATIDARSLLRRIIFPSGPQVFFRKKSARHFTIRKNAINIIHRSKRKYIDIQWLTYLPSIDEARVMENINQIILGTFFEEANISLENKLENKMKGRFDSTTFAISHPRCSVQNLGGIEFHRLLGCAEPFIIAVSKKSPIPIKVFHFGSSVAYTLADCKCIHFEDISAMG